MNAIRAMLKTTFPSVTRIYVNEVPENFVRPSFFIELGSLKREQIATSIYNFSAQWKIIYLGAEDASYSPNMPTEYDVTEAVISKLEETNYISDSGNKFQVIETTLGLSDGMVFAAVTLEAQLLKVVSDSTELMQEVIINEVINEN
jgi:hypothetical protein